MDKYFISNKTKINNLNALIYSMVVDEKIITKVLPGEAVQTAANEALWKKNLREHTDIIFNSDKIDVKIANKYIVTFYDVNKMDSDRCIAAIIGKCIYISKLKDIKHYFKQSHFSNGYYILTDNFICGNCVKYYLSEKIYNYYYEQQKMFNEIKGKECDMQTIIDLYNKAYKKYFGTYFEIIEK